MKFTVIGCDRCTQILGRPEHFDFPSVNPSNVYEAENEIIRREFADGWELCMFPDPSDPVAIVSKHYCPDCQD